MLPMREARDRRAYPEVVLSLDWELVAAASSGAVQKVQDLLQQGASPTATPQPNGHTALHAAAKEGHLEAVQCLVDAGADLEACTREGHTPLHLAVTAHKRDRLRAVAAALLQLGASATATDHAGWTPLHHAARAGHAIIFQQLLAAGADINADRADCGTPLHCACLDSSDLAAARLLALGVAVDSRDSQGRTPLHVSSSEGSSYHVQLLLKAGPSIDARDHQGRTPMLLACSSGHLGVAQKLLCSGAQPDARDNKGNVALHMASFHGTGDITGLLQASGISAHINTANSAGQTPLHIGLDSWQWRCVRALLAAGADPNALYGAGAEDRHERTIAAGTSPLQRALQIGFRVAVPALATHTNLRHWCASQVRAGMEGQQQQQQQQQQPGGGQQAVPPLHPATAASVPPGCHRTALAAAVGDGLHMLLHDAESNPTNYTCLEQAVSCFGAVRVVLGAAAVGEVLERALQGGSYYSFSLGSLLLQALHSTLLVARQHTQHLANRLQQLVSPPAQQQVGQQQAARHGVQRVFIGQQPAPGAGPDLEAMGQAAADSGNWLPFVQQLEQQMCLDPELAQSKPYLVAVQQSPQRRPGCVKGLCGALVEAAWGPGAPKPLVVAVVAVVREWELTNTRR